MLSSFLLLPPLPNLPLFHLPHQTSTNCGGVATSYTDPVCSCLSETLPIRLVSLKYHQEKHILTPDSTHIFWLRTASPVQHVRRFMGFVQVTCPMGGCQWPSAPTLCPATRAMAPLRSRTALLLELTLALAIDSACVIVCLSSLMMAWESVFLSELCFSLAQNGVHYRANGFPRTCFLPDSPKGRKVRGNLV